MRRNKKIKLSNLYQRSLGKNLFLSSFIILWVYYILLYPTLSYASEIFAEQGSNYLYHAYHHTLRTNIWLPDAGYLVWLPRVIGLLVSAVASPYYYIYVTNFIALALVAFFVSFINHQGFRSILPNDTLRFALSLIFGMIILPTYEIFTFINFSYTGFIFIAFLLFLDKEKLPCVQYIAYAILCALLCISKFHFVLFLPIFLLAMGIHWYKKQPRAAWFYLPAVITILVQIAFVLFISSKNSAFVKLSTFYGSDLFTILKKSLRGLTFWSTAYGTHFRFLGHAILTQIAGLALSGYMLFLLFLGWKNKQISHTVVCFIVTLNLIAVGFGVISSLSLSTGMLEAFFRNTEYPFNHRCFLSYDMVWLSSVILLLNVKKVSFFARGGGRFDNRNKQIFLGVFLVLSFIVTVPKLFDTARTRAGNPDAISDWSKLHVLIGQKNYIIPVEPAPFGIFAGILVGVELAQISGNTYLSTYQKEQNIPLYDETNFMSDGSLLFTTEPEAKEGEIYAIIAKHNTTEMLYAVAYNNKNEILGKTTMLSHANTANKYLLFERPIKATKFRFFDAKNQQLLDVSRAAVYILNKDK